MASRASFLTAPIFEDERIAACLDDDALIAAMLRVETGLAKVQGDMGIIPQVATQEIAAFSAPIPVSALRKGVGDTGVPVPTLLAAMRAHLSKDAGDWLHHGATSQDIVDTAFNLCFDTAMGDLAVRLAEVIDALQVMSVAHERTLMLGRTRGQLATPITFGLRVAQWARPLITAEGELAALRARALKVQFGGASGSLNALGAAGPAIADRLADALGLARAEPWHTDRSGWRSLSAWLGRVIAAMGKMADDVALSTRGEIAELRVAQGGGSSTMPHKSNPVRAEALQSVARIAPAVEAGLIAAASHAEERDGSRWAVEWALLPQLLELTGAALAHTAALTSGLQADPACMRATIDTTPGALAEAAVFALANTVGRVEATAQVKAALQDGQPLGALVQAQGGDIRALGDDAFIEPAAAIAAAIFAKRLGPEQVSP